MINNYNILNKYIIMDDVNETQYVEMILSIIDYDFIRRTNNNFVNKTDKQIKNLILAGDNEIIVSQVHAQIITQNNLFDYEFYKSHYPELSGMNPSNVLNHYFIYGVNGKYVTSHVHAQRLTKTPNFNIDFYKSYYSDLHKMNPKKLVRHYNRFGKKENRQYNNGF